MRLLICFASVSSLVFAQAPQALKMFPVPLQSEWRGWVNLGNWNANTDFDIMDSGLLEKAVEKDLAGLSRENDDSCSPKLDDVVPTAVDLGKLGIGIITNVHASCACTLRWVCPIYVYAREK